MSEQADKRRALGRPRDARVDTAILDATLALIVEHGVETMRVDDVAERAGVGKAAIYRRYRSRDELLIAAIAVLVGEITIPDTGSTKDDLLALMRDAVNVYGKAPAAQAMPALIAAMNRDSALARATRASFLASRRGALQQVLERGVVRGDLRADLDVELALDVLGGPLFYRLLITGGPIDGQLADGVVDLLLHGFGPQAQERGVFYPAGEEAAATAVELAQPSPLRGVSPANTRTYEEESTSC
jgi:AcrR family transcriptional regulator